MPIGYPRNPPYLSIMAGPWVRGTAHGGPPHRIIGLWPGAGSRRRLAKQIPRPHIWDNRSSFSADSGGDLVSTWVAKQSRACRGPDHLVNPSGTSTHANDERFALAA